MFIALTIKILSIQSFCNTMLNTLIIVTTLLIAAQGARRCKPLDVGCCISIEYKYRNASVYDKVSEDHWAYLDNKKDKSHNWLVTVKKGQNQFQLENAKFKGRCLCERQHSIISWFASSCECKQQESAQMWEILNIEEGRTRKNSDDQWVVFRRPSNTKWFLAECRPKRCVQITNRGLLQPWYIKVLNPKSC
jgi:hypothetical protein